MPEAVIYWSARDSHNAEGVVTVQLEPQSTSFNLTKRRKQNVFFSVLHCSAFAKYVQSKNIYLKHGTRVNTCVHDDSSPLEGSDPQAEPHLSTLATVRHSVLDVTVPRET